MSEDTLNFDTLNDDDFDLSDVVTLTKLPSGNSKICTPEYNNTLNEKDEIKCSIQSVKTNYQEEFDDSSDWKEEPLPSSDVIFGISYYTEKESAYTSSPATKIESATKIKPKFPGPAGFLSTDSKEFEQNLKGKRTKVIHRNNLANMNGLFVWDNALRSLGIQLHWKNSRMNIEMVKSSFTPGALYMTVPLFILGIQRIDYEPVINHDVNCILQDPTGVERGRILKQVINEFGKLIQVGSILVLRRPSVLKWSTSYMVTVTKSCLIGIYSPENDSKFTRCQEFDKNNLVSWLSESIERGEPMNNEDETSLDKNSTVTEPVSLFSSTSSFNASRPNMSSPNLSSEAVKNTAFTLLSNPATPTISRSSSHIKVHQQLDRTNNSNTTPVRSFNNNNSNSIGPFQFKSPSAVFSTARSTPYPQLARTQHISNAVKVNENSSAEDELVSQLLEGIDTDELFSGDF